MMSAILTVLGIVTHLGNKSQNMYFPKGYVSMRHNKIFHERKSNYLNFNCANLLHKLSTHQNNQKHIINVSILAHIQILLNSSFENLDSFPLTIQRNILVKHGGSYIKYSVLKRMRKYIIMSW